MYSCFYNILFIVQSGGLPIVKNSMYSDHIYLFTISCCSPASSLIVPLLFLCHLCKHKWLQLFIIYVNIYICISPLLDVLLSKTFLFFTTYFFTFIITSFAMQKLLISCNPFCQYLLLFPEQKRLTF